MQRHTCTHAHYNTHTHARTESWCHFWGICGAHLPKSAQNFQMSVSSDVVGVRVRVNVPSTRVRQTKMRLPPTPTGPHSNARNGTQSPTPRLLYVRQCLRYQYFPFVRNEGEESLFVHSDSKPPICWSKVDAAI